VFILDLFEVIFNYSLFDLYEKNNIFGKNEEDFGKKFYFWRLGNSRISAVNLGKKNHCLIKLHSLAAYQNDYINLFILKTTYQHLHQNASQKYFSESKHIFAL
jgi:hypothetical protein